MAYVLQGSVQASDDPSGVEPCHTLVPFCLQPHLSPSWSGRAGHSGGKPYGSAAVALGALLSQELTGFLSSDWRRPQNSWIL